MSSITRFRRTALLIYLSVRFISPCSGFSLQIVNTVTDTLVSVLIVRSYLTLLFVWKFSLTLTVSLEFCLNLD